MTENEFEKRFMAEMSEQQNTAVKAVQGAVLLLAVPGSGKTTVLITRLGYMINCCGISPPACQAKCNIFLYFLINSMGER